jgi:fatty acid desaturase
VQGRLGRYIPLLCVLFIAAYCVVATAVVLDNWRAALTGVVLLLLFVGLYFLFAKPTRHDASH